MVKRKRAKRVRAVRRKKRTLKAEIRETKLALAILIFGIATAASAVYKLGNITILLGLVTIAAVIAALVKRK